MRTGNGALLTAFLHREAVLDLLGPGQVNPRSIRVAIRRRVRRKLPEWIDLETRNDVPDEDVTRYEGIPATTVRRALEDLYDRMPPKRSKALADQALQRALIDERDAGELGHGTSVWSPLPRVTWTTGSSLTGTPARRRRTAAARSCWTTSTRREGGSSR